MGLTAYESARKWIRSNAGSAVLLPQNIQPEPADTVVLIDATQKMRKSPPRLTGDEFCRWFWTFLDGLPCQYVVVTMDKPSFVPPEKTATQESRPESDAFSGKSKFGPLGVLHEGGRTWRPFSGMEAVSCRAARGALMDWLYRWALEHRPTRGRDQQVVLEYEFPAGRPIAVQIGPNHQAGELGDEYAPPVGESDVGQLAWVNRFRMLDVISLQIDSDLLCIALLYLLRTPVELHPHRWIWVAGLNPWLKEPVMATEEVYEGFRMFHPSPLAVALGRQRKGNKDPVEPWFCVDLIELFRRVKTAPPFPDPTDNVRCWVLRYILQGTDYYTSKDRISHHIGPDIVEEAVTRSYLTYWKPGWEVWTSADVWSFGRMNEQQQAQFHMIATLPPESFRVLVRWQAQLLWWRHRKEEANTDAEPEQLSRLQWKFEEAKRSLARYRFPSDEEIVKAHNELWFNCAYWSRPFL